MSVWAKLLVLLIPAVLLTALTWWAWQDAILRLFLPDTRGDDDPEED